MCRDGAEAHCPPPRREGEGARVLIWTDDPSTVDSVKESKKRACTVQRPLGKLRAVCAAQILNFQRRCDTGVRGLALVNERSLSKEIK